VSYQLMFLFPGVGAQYSGMGKTFYEHFRVVRDIFAEASDILHCDMSRLCFSPEEASELDRLANSQTALLCVSVATYKVLVKETGLEQAVYLGYSLGEYSALCCAGTLSLSDALQLVRERGAIVAEGIASLEGSMAWAVNLKTELAEQICEQLRREGEQIFLSAYDSPVKTSLSGTLPALRKVGEKVVEAGGILIPIKMSGPFHCPLMYSVAERFRPVLQHSRYQIPDFPVISNVTARPYETSEEVLQNLMLHLTHPIQWRRSLEFAFQQGVTTSVEVGPKNILTYILKENSRNTRSSFSDTLQSLTSFKEEVVALRNDYFKFVAKCLSVLAGTRNNNDDLQEYEEKVVTVFKYLKSIVQNDMRLEDFLPDAKAYQRIMDMLSSALRVKKLPEEEITAHLNKLSASIQALA